MQEFWVYIFLGDEYVRCAKLSVSETKYFLEYQSSYLEREDRIDIDPKNLPAYKKTFDSSELFTAILDSAPDFWGQQLLNRKFNVPELKELEYVLANGLEHVGALAFSSTDDEVPMQLTRDGWKPHKKKPAEIEKIIEQTELMIRDVDGEKLKELYEYGPTLGGGRPKVSLIVDNKFYLAKYGTSLDSLPEQKIEYATMSMAKDLGLNVPEIKIAQHAGRDVFMIERFDRSIVKDKIDRYHFISSLAICGWFVDVHKDWSYPVFCEHIRMSGKSNENIKADLKELFRRIAFNIAVNNDDDHPRNHGLLCKNGVWRLSPLYDVFPKATLSSTFTQAMAIGNFYREASKKNLISAYKYFELDKKEAELLIDEIFQFVSSNWKNYFRNQNINEKIIQQYENAFSIKN